MNDQPLFMFNNLSGFAGLPLIYHFALRATAWLPAGLTRFRQR